MSKLEETEYFLGLDCGTSSVGYAVTDEAYNILKFNGKAMWGSHVFDEAVPAKDRRTNRCARRRLERRRQRIRLLQEIFSEEIAKIDPTFFIRLNNSKYLSEDKEIDGTDIIFNDPDFKDKDYFKKYPTIYHLRKALMEEDISDPRLLYLGIAHILKHRGHFLFPGEGISSVLDLSPILENINNAIETIFDGLSLSYETEEIEKALKQKTSSSKKEALEKAIEISDPKLKANLIKVVVGYKVKPKALFNNETYEELHDIEFTKQSFEDMDLPTLEEGLPDDEFSLIINLKALFDWALLVSVVPMNSGKEPSISDAKVQQYNINKIQLRALKDAIKTYRPDEYDSFFHSRDKDSFSAYIGKNHDSRKNKEFRLQRAKTEDFYKKIKGLLSNYVDDKGVKFILDSIENDSFLPLLSSYRNSVLPYQLNKLELERILSNATKHLPFISAKDESGFSNKEKISSLLTFRIPYYVGPIGNNKEYSGNNPPWMVRKEQGRILPWNIKEKVDFEKSAENFIQRMTNKCTYCIGEDVLPKESIAYSKYMVLNELNNLRIKGERLSVDRKQAIFNDLFLTKKKVAIKDIVKYAINHGWYGDKEITNNDISGIDSDFKASMSSYIDFQKLGLIGKDKLTKADIDRIITWITVFSEGGEMLRNKIQKEYGNILTSKDINNICRLKYSGWGRFSYKFLFELYSSIQELHEDRNIMGALWDTQKNLMELLSSNYSFKDLVDETETIGKLEYKVVEDLYTSPAVKKQIWQTLKIVDEIQRIMKHPPKKVFVEVTRGDGEKGKRTISRKDDLIKKLKIAQKSGLGFDIDVNKLISALEGKEASAISRQDKLYLYFSQCGKCMYTGEPIEIEDLYNTNIYDIDHIYPYSKSNDDSLSNRVLVKKEVNGRKTNTFPIESSIREKRSNFWKMLFDKGFIPKEKYQRLIRSTPLTEEDTEGFIKRQIVETSQSTKATIEILKAFFGNQTKIVYSKARNVSDFRKKFGFVKCRSMNELHHAKDAYLNVVVGNIFDVKYTSNFFRLADGVGYYNISKPFDYPIKNAWNVERVQIENTTDDEKYKVMGKDIETVQRIMHKNNIQYTIQQTSNDGQLFDLQLVKKGEKKGALPTKPSDPRITKNLKDGKSRTELYDEWTSKYGGYNSLKTAYFALVKHIEKKKECVSFIPIAIVDKKVCETDEGLINYCENELGLEEVSVVRHFILKNTILIIDGFPLSISGKANRGVVITLSSTVPLILSEKSEKTLKSIENYMKKKSEVKTMTVDPKHDGIDEENTESLFKELMEKNKSKIYQNRPGKQDSVFSEEGLGKFKELSLDDRCAVISEAMNYFGMGSGLANLEAIGGSKKCGTITKGSKLQKGKTSLSIVDKSITGLFESITKVI